MALFHYDSEIVARFPSIVGGALVADGVRNGPSRAELVEVFNRRSMTDGLTVRFAIGDESFTDLGSGATEQPEAGEVIFIDAAGHVAARRWCWRQSAESASSESTTDILVTVEGHHADARRDIDAAVADLKA